MNATAPRSLRALADRDTAPLRQFQRLHAGRTALLVGKGPSLEAFLRDPAPLLRQVDVVAAINEAVTVVPEPLYHFCNDPCDRWVEAIPESVACTFQPVRLLHDRSIAPAAPPSPVCLFFDHHAVDAARCDPLAQEMPITLAIGPSTAASAFQILRLMGFARLVVVGLDGAGGYVREWSGPFQDHYYRDHREARLACEHLGRAWGWDVDWTHSGPTPSAQSARTAP